ncbi:hypothetical protein D3C87_1146270 [compost metagenome]
MKMIQSLLSLMIFATTSMAMAVECVDAKVNDITNQPEVFQELISKKKNCYEAADLARACAWGSSLDVSTVATATTVCDDQMNKLAPEKEDLDLLTAMYNRCDAHHDENGGTLAQSATAYCVLSAIEFVVNLVTVE